MPYRLRRVLFGKVIASQTPRRLAVADPLLGLFHVGVGMVKVVLGIVDLFHQICKLIDVGVVILEGIGRLFRQRQFRRGDVGFPPGQFGLEMPFAVQGVDDGRIDVSQADERIDTGDDIRFAHAETPGGFAGLHFFPVLKQLPQYGRTDLAGLNVKHRFVRRDDRVDQRIKGIG